LLADGGNLLLQCTTGREGHIRKSWVFKYEIDGKRHEMGLGPLHTRGLGEARAEAKRLRQLLLDRVDPLVERRKADQARIAERAKTVTFKDCAEDGAAILRPCSRREASSPNRSTTRRCPTKNCPRS